MAKSTDFSRALDIATEPKVAKPRQSMRDLTLITQSINQSNLDDNDRYQIDQMVQQSMGALHQVEAEAQQLGEASAQQAAKLKKANLIRKLVQWGVLVVAVLLLFKVWWLSILLVIAMFIGRSIAKKQLTKQAQQVARDSWGSALAVASQIGGRSGANGDPYGLCASADALFLKSLDVNERMLELQQRQFRKQEMAAERRHQEQMAVAREQADIQREQMYEARIQSGLAADSNRQMHEQTKVAKDHAYRSAKDRYNNPK